MPNEWFEDGTTYTVSEVATILNTTPDAVDRWTRDEGLRPSSAAPEPLFTGSTVTRWLDEVRRSEQDIDDRILEEACARAMAEMYPENTFVVESGDEDLYPPEGEIEEPEIEEQP